MTILSKLFYLGLIFNFVLLTSAGAQKISDLERQRGRDMLKMIKSDIKDKYYDPTFRGVDLDAKFAAASEKLKTATSNGHIMGIIAQVLVDFRDSHTRFIPPQRANPTEYGWEMQMIGDRAFVTAVRPKSDAETKGLKVGDEVLAIDGFGTARDSLWQIKYYYYTLRPQPGMKLNIRRPDGKEEEVIVMARITQGKRVVDLVSGTDIWDLIRKQESEDYLNRHRYQKFSDTVFAWKMPAFDLTESEIDDMMGKAKGYQSLILDLRGNGGGAVKTLNRLIGHFFDHDVKVADWKGRKEFDPQIAKTRGSNYFKGKVIVLIDSESASAAEIFARVMQLEKRGTVIGDLSSGMVMVSRYYGHQSGLDVVAFFGATVTMADLIMTDGMSLEGKGVMPDKLMLPGANDLATLKDPVLAYAAESLGVKITAEDAGKLFPIEWAK